MKNYKITISLIASCLLLILATNPAKAQAFRRGSFIINLSEGWTGGTYKTASTGEYPQSIGEGHEGGTRDPLELEYGLTRHFGIGFSTGADIYNIDPSKYYGFGTPMNTVKVTTTEFTIDGSYHFMVTAKTDFSVVASFGSSSIALNGTDGDFSYQYMSKGSISRLGLHARLYFGNHFGFLAMANMFSMTNTTKNITGNNVGNGYTSSISGTALEFGLCYRIKK